MIAIQPTILWTRPTLCVCTPFMTAVRLDLRGVFWIWKGLHARVGTLAIGYSLSASGK
jgi:hypothetical protein